MRYGRKTAKAQVIIPIRESNYSKVAMVMSEKFTLEKQKNIKVKVRLDTSFLADDIYCLDIGVLRTNEDGSYLVYDNPGVKMLISLINSFAHGIKWEKQYWGNVKFPHIKLIDYESKGL